MNQLIKVRLSAVFLLAVEVNLTDGSSCAQEYHSGPLAVTSSEMHQREWLS
jgi:hypothetical protein